MDKQYKRLPRDRYKLCLNLRFTFSWKARDTKKNTLTNFHDKIKTF